MITEEKREKLLELTKMVRTFAEKNGFEVFMVPSITEEGEAETKQAIDLLLFGKIKHVISSLTGAARSDLRAALILAEAIKSAAEAEYKEFNVTKG